MRKYSVVAVLWDDHQKVNRSAMVKSVDKRIIPTLTFGALYRETKKYIVLVSEIERYDERDDVTYTVILKSCIVSMKTYADIELRKLRH